MFAVALVVGFPVPFTVAVGVSVGCPLLALCFVVGWSKSLKANPVVKGELINFAAIVGIQVGLTYVYPVYNYVFVSLAPSSQTAFALLLPMLKLAMKNWLSYIVRHMEGFNPKMVVSNVEIFHALYVACCMQCSNSNNTKILLIAMDFLQAIASIYDVDSDLRPITRIEKRIEKSRTAVRQSSRQAMEPPAASSGFHKKAQTGKDEDDGDDDMYAGKDDAAAPSSIPLLDMAQYMIEKDDQVRCHSSIRFESSHHRPSHAAQIAPQQPHARIAGKQTISVAHKSVQKLPVSAGADDSHLQTNSGPADAPPSGPPSWLTPVKRSHGSMLSEKDKKSVSALSSADRLEYVQEMLQLLHLTEFVLLVEFTEVVIPIVYSTFIIVTPYHCPMNCDEPRLRVPLRRSLPASDGHAAEPRLLRAAKEPGIPHAAAHGREHYGLRAAGSALVRAVEPYPQQEAKDLIDPPAGVRAGAPLGDGAVQVDPLGRVHGAVVARALWRRLQLPVSVAARRQQLATLIEELAWI